MEEVGVADSVVHQVDIAPQRERGVGVPEPRRHLLHVAAGLEQQRRPDVTEGVEADPRSPLAPISTRPSSAALVAGCFCSHPAKQTASATARKRKRERRIPSAQSGLSLHRAVPFSRRQCFGLIGQSDGIVPQRTNTDAPRPNRRERDGRRH